MNTIKKYIDTIANFGDLTEEDAARCFQIVMSGGATPAQIAAIMMGLRLKGEAVEEITGGALALRAKAVKIVSPEGTIDTCGTGGDGANTLNISTAVAFVLAGAGVPVAKHGNKAVSSRSGSSDVLTALGVKVDIEPEKSQEILKKTGICFLMAPIYHNAMRHVASVRQDLGIRSIFNLLGPLSNPANAEYHLLGVYNRKLVEPMAEVLRRLGVKRAWVVNGEDGLDELTLSGITHVAELKNNNVSSFELTPHMFGLSIVTKNDIEGGNAEFNANEMLKLLKGVKNPYREIVLYNASAGLVIAGKSVNIIDGVKLAAHSIDSGAAKEKLDQLILATNSQ